MYILSHVEFRSDTDRLFNGENRVKKQCIVTNTMYVMWIHVVLIHKILSLIYSVK